uniref:Uncharacterized protein n=1 Tax=Ditylenchus dipsaci TaxID=166011 RepID=A0A915DRX4_9BILA
MLRNQHLQQLQPISIQINDLTHHLTNISSEKEALKQVFDSLHNHLHISPQKTEEEKLCEELLDRLSVLDS